jgi:hypothetical protein
VQRLLPTCIHGRQDIACTDDFCGAMQELGLHIIDTRIQVKNYASLVGHLVETSEFELKIEVSSEPQRTKVFLGEGLFSLASLSIAFLVRRMPGLVSELRSKHPTRCTSRMGRMSATTVSADEASDAGENHSSPPYHNPSQLLTPRVRPSCLPLRYLRSILTVHDG